MLRWLAFIILLVLVAILAGTLAASPGELMLQWGDYRVTTSVAVFALLLAVLLAVVALLYRLWWSVRRAPAKLAGMTEDRRQRRGYEALSRGLVAVAAGDAETADKQAQRAGKLLDDRPLTMLLLAQAAQMRGDEQAAARFFAAMREHAETEFLGLRGLLSQAMRRHDWQQSLELAERAYQLNPKSDWVISTFYELNKQVGRWTEAERLLDRSMSAKLLPPAAAAHERADLLYRKSLEAAGGDAVRLAQKAFDADPGFVPAAARFARLLVGEGKLKKAATVVERAWTKHPDPELADVYWAATESTDALKKVRAAQHLSQFNPDHVESRVTIAVAALEARLWGEARSNLESIAGDDAPPRICRLMATLEEAEHGDIARARTWLMRAAREDAQGGEAPLPEPTPVPASDLTPAPLPPPEPAAPATPPAPASASPPIPERLSA
jgi:HemY protein